MSEEVTLEKLQSEELSLLTNIGQMAAEFFSLFNGPLLISLQYYRDRASLMVQTVKNSPASVGDAGSSSLIVWEGRSPGEGKRQPTLVFLPGESHGQKSLAGYSPWGCKRVGHDFTTKQQQSQREKIKIFLWKQKNNLLGHLEAVKLNLLELSGKWMFTLSYWSWIWCKYPPGDLPNPGMKPVSPALQVNSLPSEP